MAVGSRKDDGDRFVTVSELADKISALRWELRFYVLALVAVALVKFPAVAPTALGWFH